MKAKGGISRRPRTAADIARHMTGIQVITFPVKIAPNSQTRRNWDFLNSVVAFDALLV